MAPVPPGVLGAIAGFLGALVTIAIPVAKALLDTRRDAHKAVRLLTGEEEVEGDGVIPRLRRVERRTEEHRTALADSRLDIPQHSETDVAPETAPE
ncbi:hypothetical protein RYH80_05650 [Halobaculum sp. MBLA0147]|uniref:hypothetical protein n=1 Tax=Halobaculum sp. MBLA0147 TaxID=3079934 RepID=UPI00352639A6